MATKPSVRARDSVRTAPEKLAANLVSPSPETPAATSSVPQTMAATLMAWRTAERQLASLPAGSREGDAIRAEITALRLRYQELSGQFAAWATPDPRSPLPR